jgi:IS1 family transposase/transposase-like protein
MAASKRIHQMTIGEWEVSFPTEDACADYLVKHRWPSGIVKCPRCGAEVRHPVATMPFKWQCYSCTPDSGYRFSHISGTIFENTNKPLRDWFRVIHMMLTSKKGVSALQVHRVMGFGSYKTAWYMCHRVRAGLANEEFRRLMGIVEVDETYIGGKGRNRHGPPDGDDKGRSTKRKTAVIGAVERKGKVVAKVIERADIKTVLRFVNETVSTKVSLVAHDDYKAYRALPQKQIPHGAVNHSKGQYVVGQIHTNTIEGFWSLIKRGVVGTYHKVSRKYLQPRKSGHLRRGDQGLLSSSFDAMFARELARFGWILADDSV